MCQIWTDDNYKSTHDICLFGRTSHSMQALQTLLPSPLQVLFIFHIHSPHILAAYPRDFTTLSLSLTLSQVIFFLLLILSFEGVVL